MISHFLFDLGNVLFTFDFTRILKFLEDRKTRLDPVTILRVQGQMEEYERGKMTTDDFFQNVKKEIEYTGTFEEFYRGFTEIFDPNPDAINAALALRTRYPIYILSNTNEMHIQYLKDRFDILQKFQGCVFSFEVGSIKPEPRIFHIAIERLNIQPNQTLFIDDKRENIAAAGSMGFHTLLYPLQNGKSCIMLQDELTKFGVCL